MTARLHTTQASRSPSQRPRRNGSSRPPPPGQYTGSVPPENLSLVLSRIARTVSETLDLKQVVASVADATAELMPFDAFIVMRFDGPSTFVLHSFVTQFDTPPTRLTLDDFSPALREYFPRFGLLEDLDGLLDPSFALDRRLREDGLMSAIAIPIQRGDRLDAILAVGSKKKQAYGDQHETALRLVADLVGLALEHERLWSLDVARRKRLDNVDSLLPTLAQALDVREVFNQVSAVVKPVLRHDRLVLTSLSPDQRTVTIDAVSGEAVPELTCNVMAVDPLMFC